MRPSSSFKENENRKNNTLYYSGNFKLLNRYIHFANKAPMLTFSLEEA